MNLDELRQQCLNKALYPFDGTIMEGIFTADEITGINKCGY